MPGWPDQSSRGWGQRRWDAPPGNPRWGSRPSGLQRSLDYLQSRFDIAGDRLGVFAISGGTYLAITALARDTRVRAAVLAESGLRSGATRAETDVVNFAPHVRTPVLMLNGRDDFITPLDASQRPLFRLFGTPEGDKRQILFDTGHMGNRDQYIKETLAWFDRYLGRVHVPDR